MPSSAGSAECLVSELIQPLAAKRAICDFERPNAGLLLAEGWPSTRAQGPPEHQARESQSRRTPGPDACDRDRPFVDGSSLEDRGVDDEADRDEESDRAPDRDLVMRWVAAVRTVPASPDPQRQYRYLEDREEVDGPDAQRQASGITIETKIGSVGEDLRKPAIVTVATDQRDRQARLFTIRRHPSQLLLWGAQGVRSLRLGESVLTIA